MHYYKKNIGDYAKKTGRLSMLQHGALTLLNDACYDREVFPTFEQAIEWTWASTKEEIEAVEFVLKRFFKLSDGVFVQDEILLDLLDYKSKADVNKRIAAEREARRRQNITNRERAVNEPPPNHKPQTKEPLNQEPILNTEVTPLVQDSANPERIEQKKSKTTKSKTANIDRPMDVNETVWDDFVELRKKKKAPISETALTGLRREAVAAGISLTDALRTCCQNGWQGFKADWIKPRGQHLSFAERDLALKKKQYREITGQDCGDRQFGEVIDAQTGEIKFLEG